MKNIKIILALFVCLFVQSQISFAQTAAKKEYRKISEMIADYEKLNGIYKDTFKMDIPLPEDYGKSETTILGAITYPNWVKVKYSAKSHKIDSIRKEAVNRWWKDFDGFADNRYFYANEIKVEEDNKPYWLMADENHVINKLKDAAKKGETVVLHVQIIGYHRKGKKYDYFLMADKIE